ncbi:hypothetical protein [Leifsonia shinshuensis]|uniref:Uncharacterized protein n=1 Tax=Leifsonia shinshuensis TaxID=150026 RepID=A0A853CZ90_9MICO|nr:hypothetical protein [Leifsonia shinshuensis]NYJ25942.1 hypothetical protein [Leifsonia shinshuensis]
MSSKSRGLRRGLVAVGLAGVAALAVAAPALAQPTDGHGEHGNDEHSVHLTKGDLLVSTSRWTVNPNVVAGQTVLPTGVTAVAGGGYPGILNNDKIDGSFGVTTPISLSELDPRTGSVLQSFEVPSSEAVTSFSSKSELALNQSTRGDTVTFMGYASTPGQLDVSNSNTPGVIDPTNPNPNATYRVVISLGVDGKFTYTETNAYSGNNGRAAILNDSKGAKSIYTAGNAGNGANPQPKGVVLGAGAQILTPSKLPEAAQTPAQPTPVGSFSITQLGRPADKVGKDDNFRGLTVSNNVLYFTKGSGSNGVNTVYFLDTTGTACPSGVGVPAAGAQLPSAGLTADAQTGLLPNNMCILAGFPTTSAKTDTTFFPFGLWFANKDTLYVAQEGDGSDSYNAATGTWTAAASSTTAGLQKYSFDTATQSWKLDYTLQNGLNLGTSYTVAGYPTGTNSYTGLPWAPAVDGLRNINGRVDDDGTVTIWAATSTVSGSGDQGGDPNALVTITDRVRATTPAADEKFHTVIAPANGTVVRGVSFTPGTK